MQPANNTQRFIPIERPSLEPSAAYIFQIDIGKFTRVPALSRLPLVIDIEFQAQESILNGATYYSWGNLTGGKVKEGLYSAIAEKLADSPDVLKALRRVMDAGARLLYQGNEIFNSEFIESIIHNQDGVKINAQTGAIEEIDDFPRNTGIHQLKLDIDEHQLALLSRFTAIEPASTPPSPVVGGNPEEDEAYAIIALIDRIILKEDELALAVDKFLSKDDECELESMINKLLLGTKQYATYLNEQKRAESIKQIVTKLQDSLSTKETSAKQKLTDFYAIFDQNLQTIEEDLTVPTKNYLIVAAIIAATLFTGILPGLLVIGLVYAITGKKPTDLLQVQPNGGEFIYSVRSLKSNSFFKPTITEMESPIPPAAPAV